MDRLQEIKARWRGSALLDAWRGLAPADRQRALGEIEELSRSVRDSNPSTASAITAALDVLDITAVAGAFGTSRQAEEDIRWLLEEIEAAQSAER